MDINVRIEAPILADAINALAVAIAGNMELLLSRPQITQVSIPADVAAPAISPLPVTPVETAPAQLPVAPTAAQAQPATVPVAPPSVQAPTIVEIREKAQEKGKSPEAKQAIKALLDKYGSRSISLIPEEHRASFLLDLETI